MLPLLMGSGSITAVTTKSNGPGRLFGTLSEEVQHPALVHPARRGHGGASVQVCRRRAQSRSDLLHETLSHRPRRYMSSESPVVEIERPERVTGVRLGWCRLLVPAEPQPWNTVWSRLVVDGLFISTPHGKRPQAIEHFRD